MDFENEESEDAGEFESIRVPITNAETTKYEKVQRFLKFFLSCFLHTDVFLERNQCFLREKGVQQQEPEHFIRKLRGYCRSSVFSRFF